MKPIVTDTDDHRWQVVRECDTRADGQFVFTVLTTGICCHPPCRSRRARRENVRFFANVAAAVTAGFCPCKRCQSDENDPQQQRVDKVAQACRLLEQGAPLTLEALARKLAVNPFHFHRLSRPVIGMTPRMWQQAWRARHLREALEQGSTMTHAALVAGFPNSSSYYHQADAALGMAARQFRRGSATTVVTQTTGGYVLGRCLVTQSERDVCVVLPGGSDTALLDDLRQRSPSTELRQGTPEFRRQMAEVFVHLDDSRRPVSLSLDLQDTAFQLQVWRALRQISAGRTHSYRQVTGHAGLSRAARAVTGACAANSLAVIVPCHRVVRGGGALSGYRWGTARKAQPLTRETQYEEE